MTLASFGTKILSFLMVPLYTNILSTEAYGTYDIYQTTLFLIVPVLSLNIADGIMRFSLDETYDYYLLKYNQNLSRKAVKESTGIPRRINRICEKSLMYASQQGKRLIDEHLVRYIIEHEMLGGDV